MQLSLKTRGFWILSNCYDEMIQSGSHFSRALEGQGVWMSQRSLTINDYRLLVVIALPGDVFGVYFLNELIT